MTLTRSILEGVLSGLPVDATAADAAEAIAQHGAVRPLVESEAGDVAPVRGGGVFADPRGRGARKGDVKAARALFANTPEDVLISVRDGESEFVIDVKARKVRRPRSVITGAVRTPSRSRPQGASHERQSQRPPAPPSRSKAEATLRAARAQQSELEAELREAEKSLAALRARAARKRKEATRLQEDVGRGFVGALKEGRDPPDYARERDAILRAQMEADACEALVPEAEEQVRQANRDRVTHIGKLAEAALDLDAALTREAIADAERAFKPLAEPLAALEAVSIVRAGLLGRSFAFDPRRHAAPIGGSELVSTILDGIPQALAPSLSRDAVRARAEKIAARLLASFQSPNGE